MPCTLSQSVWAQRFAKLPARSVQPDCAPLANFRGAVAAKLRMAAGQEPRPLGLRIPNPNSEFGNARSGATKVLR